jgi:hypothetical protein
MDLAGRFLAFQRCEAMVYIPLPFVNRFVGRAGQEKAFTALFGSERWREALRYEGEARVRFLHGLFQEQLCFGSSERLVRSFEIPTAEGNGYRLYFTTGNEKGLEKMKEAMWRADPLGGAKLRGACKSSSYEHMFVLRPDGSDNECATPGDHGLHLVQTRRAGKLTARPQSHRSCHGSGREQPLVCRR